mmetsp:Transcript_24803/g.46349  ORF Transcript_24803/g.46349 Transcript_24803/m.46349 type:complete len:173 (-) Transcript_24803:87-605(-)
MIQPGYSPDILLAWPMQSLGTVLRLAGMGVYAFTLSESSSTASGLVLTYGVLGIISWIVLLGCVAICIREWNNMPRQCVAFPLGIWGMTCNWLLVATEIVVTIWLVVLHSTDDASSEAGNMGIASLILIPLTMVLAVTSLRCPKAYGYKGLGRAMVDDDHAGREGRRVTAAQ